MAEIGCTIDADCPEGYICLGGQCVPDYIEGGGGGGGGEAPLPGIGAYLQRRYTSNLAITEQLNAADLLHEVIFPAARLYLTQSELGKIAIKNKKPTPYAYATAAVAASTTVDVDNVSEWIGNVNNLILKTPHTNESEIREVTAAAYATDQNSITCSNTGGLLTTPNFSGYSAPSTPATSTFTVNSATAATACTVTVDGVVFEFTTSTGDTTDSIAAYLTGVISAHPALSRKFTVAYTAGASTLTLTARTGRLTVGTAFEFASDAPLANPTTAPTLGGSGTDTTFIAGDYAVAYSAINANGETLLSNYKVVTLTATQHIDVSTVSLPSGATALRWYCSPAAASNKLRFIAENNGASFDITTLPLLTAALPPDLNRTGAEIMRVNAVFSDRLEDRSDIAASNVLKATFNWLLGNREKSINRVDLKFRDASQDYRLVELRMTNDAHIAKTNKVSPLEVNGQAINNTDQAQRITAGILAEKRDADFFYEWRATRAALLLQEGDVVAITDDGSGVYNLPVIIESIKFDIPTAAMPFVDFVGRKYASNMYDDSIVERTIPVVSEEYTPPVAPIAPEDIAAIWALYDAASYSQGDGTNITTNWTDTSGNARHATVSGTPTYETSEINSLPVVRFGADSNDYFTLPSMAALTAVSRVRIIKVTTLTTSGGDTFGTAGDLDHYPHSGGSIYPSFGSTARKGPITSGVTLSTWHVVYEYSISGDWALFQNWTETYQTDTNTVGLSATPKIGTNGTYYQKMDLALDCYFSAQLEPSEIAGLTQWITDTYGL